MHSGNNFVKKNEEFEEKQKRARWQTGYFNDKFKEAFKLMEKIAFLEHTVKLT